MILFGIPFPPLYLLEKSAGKFVLVDGTQRIGAIWKFFNNELYLDIERKELNDLQYKDLPLSHQNRFDYSGLDCVMIPSHIPDELRFEILRKLCGWSTEVMRSRYTWYKNIML